VILRSHKVQIGPNRDNPLDYSIVGRRFDMVHAVSSAGGSDYARMHDTSGVDHLVAGFQNGQSWVSLSRPAGVALLQMYDAIGFDSVRAVNDFGDTPANKKDVDSVIDLLMLDGDWDQI
jgi:hypothetical protein